MWLKVVQIVTFFVFETPKANWKFHFKNHFYFQLQVFTVYFRSTCVYINVKTDIII